MYWRMGGGTYSITLIMKRTLFLLASVILLSQLGKAQDTVKTNQFYDNEFKWKIIIPPNFQTVSLDEWNKFKNKGSEAVEKTYDQKVVDKSKTIFVFRSDNFNYFEANYQPFDIKTDGDYLASNKAVDKVLYNTLKAQIPNVTVDSASTQINVGNLPFNAFILRASLPNNIVFSIYSFSRLFGKKDFTVNIMFVNSTKGDIMLNAWKSSTFGN